MTHPLLRCRLGGDCCRCISDVTFSYASCAPVTSLPSAVTTSVYEQVSSLSPSETAILCRQRRCCNDCFLLIGCCSHGGSYCCILWWSVTIAFGSTTGQSGARRSDIFFFLVFLYRHAQLMLPERTSDKIGPIRGNQLIRCTIVKDCMILRAYLS